MHGRPDAERQRNDQHEADRHGREEERSRASLHELFGNRLLRRVREAEVAVRDTAKPAPILDEKWLIKPHLMARLCKEFLRNDMVACLEHHRCRIAGCEHREAERQERHAEERHQHLRQLLPKSFQKHHSYQTCSAASGTRKSPSPQRRKGWISRRHTSPHTGACRKSLTRNPHPRRSRVKRRLSIRQFSWLQFLVLLRLPRDAFPSPVA